MLHKQRPEAVIDSTPALTVATGMVEMMERQSHE